MIKGKEVCVDGSVLSRGIAIGTPYFLDVPSDVVPDKVLSSLKAVEDEVRRYRKAIRESHQYLSRLKTSFENESGKEIVEVLESHLQIIKDPLLNEQMEEEIRSSCKNAESALHKVVERFEKKFHEIQDPFFQERIEDIHDISKRILDCLQKRKKACFTRLLPHSIVFAAAITPSEAAEAKRNNVAAFITEIGSGLSHTAIVAKARGIPYISGVPMSLVSHVGRVEMVIVDGLSGKIIFNPAQETISRYTELQKRLTEQYALFWQSAELPSKTTDEEAVSLYVSIDDIEECPYMHGAGIYGIGLFRTEYLVLRNGTFPTEEEQFSIYRDLVSSIKKQPVVIRCFDLGLDKLTPHSIDIPSHRSFQFLLEEKEIFLNQLRAILRASSFGNVQLLLPMVSSMEELNRAKSLVTQAERDVRRKGHEIGKPIPIGCMIEVPRAAMLCDQLAKACDFLSIGTNDLMQYTLALDRLHQSSTSFSASLHPGFLRLIQLVIHEAKKAGVPVYLCGEMASDPKCIPLLVGLGVQGFSVPIRILPVIKHIVRCISKKESQELIEYLFEEKNSKAVEETLLKYYQKKFSQSVREHF